VMAWQLDAVVREEPYLDYRLPLQQFNGTNVALVEALTVQHPLSSERDAENYVTALGQVGLRMDEAVEEVRRLQSKQIIPPRFILAATILQMQAFTDTPPGQNAVVAAVGGRVSALR